MSRLVIVRDYKSRDYYPVSELVRKAYLSNVNSSWCNAVMREITFELIIMLAAVMFILIGVPMLYCIFAIPLVLSAMYFTIYGAFLLKATELMYSKKTLHCWVAEACEPLLLHRPQVFQCRLLSEEDAIGEGVEMSNYNRKIVGTVAVSQHSQLNNSTWLFRLAVDLSYRRKGVAHSLVQQAKKWCRNNKFDSIELAMSECQDGARQLFTDTGFEIRQLYHKQLIGSGITMLMYQLTTDLSNMRSYNF